MVRGRTHSRHAPVDPITVLLPEFLLARCSTGELRWVRRVTG
ncbi:hypothetical protein E2C01_053746 [Portunus trituberculatus]|uniref:Uncharacterized protein n=1 Tax=Portunus trituberculatus TaxID=210409 RepID=A0A5B7GRM8_PORTR|nr:hypothetical protein [Portunus trituberculatus]